MLPYGSVVNMVDIDIPFWVYSAIRAGTEFMDERCSVKNSYTIIEENEKITVKVLYLEEEIFATIYYNSHNQIHRPNDLPAVIKEYSSEWFKNGKRHRENDKPAIICSEFGDVWFQNNIIYREHYKASFINKKGMEFVIRDNKFYSTNEANQLKVKNNINKF